MRPHNTLKRRPTEGKNVTFWQIPHWGFLALEKEKNKTTSKQCTRPRELRNGRYRRSTRPIKPETDLTIYDYFLTTTKTTTTTTSHSGCQFSLALNLHLRASFLRK
jgi:NAD-dependent DNA ligase